MGKTYPQPHPFHCNNKLMKGTLTCTPKQLLEWLDKHLDDCPADWETDDFSGRDGTAIVFNTKEENS